MAGWCGSACICLSLRHTMAPHPPTHPQQRPKYRTQSPAGTLFCVMPTHGAGLRLVPLVAAPHRRLVEVLGTAMLHRMPWLPVLAMSAWRVCVGGEGVQG